MKSSQSTADAARAYTAGDFKAARRLAGEILKAPDLDEETRVRANRILRSTGIDPAAVVGFSATLLLFLYICSRFLF